MKRSEAHLDEDLAQVVETVYETMDLAQEFKRLNDNLEIGEDRGDYSAVNRHLDRAESNARKAHRAFLQATLRKKSFDLANEAILAPLRSEANRHLQVEKAQGDRSKAITDADVRAKMIELFHDEIKDQEEKRMKVDGALEHLQVIVDLWKSRCRSLQSMLTQIRK